MRYGLATALSLTFALIINGHLRFWHLFELVSAHVIVGMFSRSPPLRARDFRLTNLSMPHIMLMTHPVMNRLLLRVFSPVVCLLLGSCGGGGGSNAPISSGISSVPIARAFAASRPSCFSAWSTNTVYTAGATASFSGVNYTANWWNQGNDPSRNNGGSGSGQPWTSDGSCGTPVSSPTSTPVAAPVTTVCGTTSLSPWDPQAIYTHGQMVSYLGMNYVANWWTQGNTPSTHNGGTGTGQIWTIVSSCGSVVPAATPTLAPTPALPPKQLGKSTGIIDFHLLLGIGTAQDQMVLDGGNYDDLIISNIIAGVMYGHLIQEYYPRIQFNKDYMYGAILGQLLQENIATEYYTSSTDQIDPSPNQAAVMGVGQGGPYQINNYAADMVAGTYTPAGHSLINYVALQKNIGYTMATAANQYTQPTPASFNNKYYGPMLVAYFHYNDFVSLIETGAGSGGWLTPWQPAYNDALKNFSKIPGNFLDMVLNVAYNQGYYGGLVLDYSQKGTVATPQSIALVNNYNSIWGANNSYQQYPYQVRYYDDQFYDNPIPTSNLATVKAPTNHVIFDMMTLRAVFSNVFQQISYVNNAGNLAYFSLSQTSSAFDVALAATKTTSTASLELSKSIDRQQIFAILENAITNLEVAAKMKFNTTTLTQMP